MSMPADNITSQITRMSQQFSRLQTELAIGRQVNAEHTAQAALEYFGLQTQSAKYLVDSLVKSYNIRSTIDGFLSVTQKVAMGEPISAADWEIEGRFADYMNTLTSSANANFWCIVSIHPENAGEVLYTMDEEYLALNLSKNTIYIAALEEARTIRRLFVIQGKLIVGAAGFLKDLNAKTHALLIAGSRIDEASIRVMSRQLHAEMVLYMREETQFLPSKYSTLRDYDDILVKALKLPPSIEEAFTRELRRYHEGAQKGLIDPLQLRETFRIVEPQTIEGTHYVLAYQGIMDESGVMLGVLAVGHNIHEIVLREESVIANLNKAMLLVQEAAHKIFESLEYAKTIQDSLLPEISILQSNLPRCFSIWKPREIVSGDLYSVDFIGEDFLIVMIDCTGHGVPGALMTMMVSAQLKQIISAERCYHPSAILQRLNVLTKAGLQKERGSVLADDGLDASVCYINTREKVIFFAGARQSMLYIDEEGGHYMHGDKKSIGYLRSQTSFEFTTHTLPYKAGMSLYLFTDGLIDQIGGEQKQPFGKERLKHILEKCRGVSSEMQENKLLSAIQEHMGGAAQVDDITVFGVTLD